MSRHPKIAASVPQFIVDKLASRGIAIGSKVQYRCALGGTKVGTFQELYGTQFITAVIDGTAMRASAIIGLVKVEE